MLGAGEVHVRSTSEIDIELDEPLGDGAPDPTTFTVSGTGRGTFADHPDSITMLAPGLYRLTWATGEMIQGGDITLTVDGAYDLAGNPVGSRNSGTDLGGGLGFITAAPDAVDLSAEADRGVADDDDLTCRDNSSPGAALVVSVTGTIAGATVTVYADGVAVGQVVALGTETVVTTDGVTEIHDGLGSITARQTEPGRRESPDSAALAVTIDSHRPVLRYESTFAIRHDVDAYFDSGSAVRGADLDGDGDLDVVAAGSVADTVAWWANEGGGLWSEHTLATGVDGATSLDIADLDGDGDLDLVVTAAFNAWEKPESQSMIWLENDGQMRFRRRDVANTPTHLQSLAVGDFDGDGRTDLVTGGMHICAPYDRMDRVVLWTNTWPGGERSAPAHQ